MTQQYNVILPIGKDLPVYTGIKLCQGDSGITFKITVPDFDTTGTTASIIFNKYDKNVVQSAITSTDGVYSYTTLGTELTCVGQVVTDVKFYDSNNKRISSASFVFEVTPDTINSSVIESGTYSDSINTAVNRCNTAAEAAEEAVAGLIPIATSTTVGGVKSGGSVTVGQDGKMTIDVSNENVTFTEPAQDSELTSGSKLSVLIGLIKKKFSIINNNLDLSGDYSVYAIGQYLVSNSSRIIIFVPFLLSNQYTITDIKVQLADGTSVTNFAIAGQNKLGFTLYSDSSSNASVIGKYTDVRFTATKSL